MAMYKHGSLCNVKSYSIVRVRSQWSSARARSRTTRGTGRDNSNHDELDSFEGKRVDQLLMHTNMLPCE